MSYYDTENMMQTKGNGYLQKSLIKVDLLSDEIEEAIKVLYELEPSHCKSAFFHTKVKGDNSPHSRMDKFLGIDNILEYEDIKGTTLFVAIDWTDNPDFLDKKYQRMDSRKSAYDCLGIDFCLAVCVSNQVLLQGTKQENNFISNAYNLIFDEIDKMKATNVYSSKLNIDMKKNVV